MIAKNKFRKTLATVCLVSCSTGVISLAEAKSTVIEQEVTGVTPEMLNWWWDNINTTARYKQWTGDNNSSFSWQNSPDDSTDLSYDVGASYDATDTIGSTVRDISVTLVQPSASSLDHSIKMSLDVNGVASNTAATTVSHEYEMNSSSNALVIRSSINMPDATDQALPGYFNGLKSNIQSDMQNLASFLPALFTSEFVEQELLSRGSYTVSRQGFFNKKVVVTQDIKGLTPDMVNWWWDNIDTTQRYKKWHPTSHKSFKWTSAPSNPNDLEYSVGAVQQVSEDIGGSTSNLTITWLNPSSANTSNGYSDFVYGKSSLTGLSFLSGNLLHEYRVNNAGDGITMKSTFTFPSLQDSLQPGFSDGLGKHALQEMQFLQYFLPDLFEAEYLNQ